MKRLLINVTAMLCICIGGLFIGNTALATHEEWHNGPSCGENECHCMESQECTENGPGPGNCSCTNLE